MRFGCLILVCRSKLRERWEKVSRNRLAGADCKPPYAAVIKSHGRERYGKGALEASGVDQEDERK